MILGVGWARLGRYSALCGAGWGNHVTVLGIHLAAARTSKMASPTCLQLMLAIN